MNMESVPAQVPEGANFVSARIAYYALAVLNL